MIDTGWNPLYNKLGIDSANPCHSYTIAQEMLGYLITDWCLSTLCRLSVRWDYFQAYFHRAIILN